MPALLVAAAIGAGIGLAKTAFGASRFNKGRKEYEAMLKNMPQYEIPDEYGANVDLAKSAYQSGMPGADIAKNMIYSSTASGLSRAEEASASSIDLLGATTDMYAKEMDALNNLAFQEAQYKAKGLESLMGANLQMGAEKSKAFEYNKWIPQQMRMNAASSKMGFGQSLMQAGINDMAGSITSYFTEKGKIEELSKIFGKDK